MLQVPDIGKAQIRRIIKAIKGLNQMPNRFKLYQKGPWRDKGLRVLPIDNYLVFYLIEEVKDIVVIIRIMYSGRNIKSELFDIN